MQSNINNAYRRITDKWQQLKASWNRARGKNLLFRAALAVLILTGVLLAAVFLLLLLPLMFISAGLMALRIKTTATITPTSTRRGPVTINITPERISREY